MSWKKFDECTSCKFYRRSKPMPLCKFCGVGEFFEERDPDGPLTFEMLMRISNRMTKELDQDDRTPTESDAIFAADRETNDE